MPAAPDLFLRPQGPLRPADAVAALLTLGDGRYVVQLRDALPGIFYPDHWGCFGGAVDDGESPRQALQRELREELEFEPQEAREFTRFDFDFTGVGSRRTFRIYYEVPVSEAAWRRFSLHEGSDMRAIPAADLLLSHRTVPYDAFAIWMHLSRSHIA